MADRAKPATDHHSLKLPQNQLLRDEKKHYHGLAIALGEVASCPNEENATILIMGL